MHLSLTSDHDVAVESKLGAPPRVEVAEVGGEEPLSQGPLLPTLSVNGGQQVVGVCGVLHLHRNTQYCPTHS